jgi:hypothetical protein
MCWAVPPNLLRQVRHFLNTVSPSAISPATATPAETASATIASETVFVILLGPFPLLAYFENVPPADETFSDKVYDFQRLSQLIVARTVKSEVHHPIPGRLRMAKEKHSNVLRVA